KGLFRATSSSPGRVFSFERWTAYELATLLEFRRVLFRSRPERQLRPVSTCSKLPFRPRPYRERRRSGRWKLSTSWSSRAGVSTRSEERRVGKEGRSGGATQRGEKKTQNAGAARRQVWASQ